MLKIQGSQDYGLKLVLDNQQCSADGDHSILIVDDDENILDQLSEGFELYGLGVIKASNGLHGWYLFDIQKLTSFLPIFKCQD